MRVRQESRLNRSRKIDVPSLDGTELKNYPTIQKRALGQWLPVSSVWGGENIAYAGLPEG